MTLDSIGSPGCREISSEYSAVDRYLLRIRRARPRLKEWLNVVELRADAYIRSRRGRHRLLAGPSAGPSGTYRMVWRPRPGTREKVSRKEKRNRSCGSKRSKPVVDRSCGTRLQSAG